MNNLTLNGSSECVVHNLREKDRKRVQERRRNIIYLIKDYLNNEGFVKSAETLEQEARLSMDTRVCDNIDLEMILMQYESYYHLQFNKYPILCKKSESLGNANTSENVRHAKKKSKSKEKNVKKTECEKISQQVNSSTDDINLVVSVKSLFNECGDQAPLMESFERSSYSKISKSIDDLYPADSEMSKIAEMISKEIVMTDLNVHWDDVKGLENCKAAIQEAVVYPLKYPVFFKGKFTPWNGVLLYGPPGTGKTMLAKAVATECNCTFFNITASSLVSKWRGDSEKYIRVLFDLAYKQSPTIIFIDEIDWIASTTDNSLSEPARRFRAELLARLDGVMSIENSNIVLMAATNVPWNIDAALLRRLEKVIYVSLPDMDTRLNMFRYYVSSKTDMQEIVNLTKGYSGADIKMLCKQAWIWQSIPTWERLEKKEITVLDVNYQILNCDYLIEALKYVKPTVNNDLISLYINWRKSATNKCNHNSAYHIRIK
ncbi:katanin p60 ATPase-containing subunit A-like 2 [Hylaeus anthracinus]|uniref:katanin p60 ATPase-containing subunit A-like 2 n=1 Tax=Hylaeus anthracinus TaxID=313031 RepID=UPI0023BA3CD2|nr:katanin p60 ATPase-containing subunit A-like 2 [Hylaeus anthracinus]